MTITAQRLLNVPAYPKGALGALKYMSIFEGNNRDHFPKHHIKSHVSTSSVPSRWMPRDVNRLVNFAYNMLELLE